MLVDGDPVMEEKGLEVVALDLRSQWGLPRCRSLLRKGHLAVVLEASEQLPSGMFISACRSCRRPYSEGRHCSKQNQTAPKQTWPISLP